MSQIETFRYDDEFVRKFLLATIFWGVVGLLLGVIIATQLVFWETNLGPWFSFGRLRPLHTNAVIFAFVGNGMFAGIYHSMQRLCKARMFSDALSNINFWGWQLIIVAAAVTLPLAITVSKEYAELEWPIDVAITLVWGIFCNQFFRHPAGTARTSHLRRHLVLHGHGYHGSPAAHRQFPRTPCNFFKKLLDLCRSPGCFGPVVVRP